MRCLTLSIVLVTLPCAACTQGEQPGQTAPKASEKSDTVKPAAKPTVAPSKSATDYKSESLRGKVVWLAEALTRRYGVRIDADAAEWQVALETADGELVPLMKEDRGRGFWKDARLRGIEMELMVRRYKGAPVVQVIRVYTLKEGKKYEIDYWCDICAIPMYELKDCECCQGPIRIREREVGE